MANPTRTVARLTIIGQELGETVYDEPTEGPVLKRNHARHIFRGDIKGVSVAELLRAVCADDSHSFVGIERVTGKIGDREGTFLLQSSGVVKGELAAGKWFVIPQSGTGHLAGLRGEGSFCANLGEDAQASLDYWFE